MKTTKNLSASDDATCSWLIFQCRWYDSKTALWGKWIDREQIDMVKGNAIPKIWVEQAEHYIVRGAPCEYRIIERIDRITWALSYVTNA